MPGYYQRLMPDGSVATGTCCADTAPENAMMGKLVVDSIVTWAKEYKVDGFRFDLMGFHPKANILAVRKALDALTLRKDGVDGKAIILYGEGWNFGEVADNARFVQATQANMAGTGIATFSDRARDAVRGGSPFDERPGRAGLRLRPVHRPQLIGCQRAAGRAAGAAAALPGPDRGRTDRKPQGVRLHRQRGKQVTGAEVDYNGSPAGYADAPGDALAYVDAHDNESLYDALAYKLPAGTSAADRARMQVLAEATAALVAGPRALPGRLGPAALQVARRQLLRLRATGSTRSTGTARRATASGRAAAGRRQPGQVAVRAAPVDRSAGSSPAARRSTAPRPRTRTCCGSAPASRRSAWARRRRCSGRCPSRCRGTAETPGVITMRAGDLVVVFNATPQRQDQRVASLAGTHYVLHPAQARGSDPVVKTAAYAAATATFTVPARTVAVFTTGE